MRSVCVALVTLPVLLACARPASRVASCGPLPEDRWLNGQPVYPECGVTRPARLVGTAPRTGYSPSGSQACHRAVLEVVVDTTGELVESTVRQIEATDPALAQALRATLPARRYQPAERDGRKVPQVMRVQEAIATRTVVVPAGSGPPRSARPPSC